MPSVWISALKEYNKEGMWCLPKKGSAEHAEVMKIMDRMKSKAEPVAAAKTSKAEEPKRKLRTEKEKKESEMMAKAEPEKKTRKAKAKAPESESDSDIPVPKPKVRAEPAVAKPKAKSSKMVYKGEKFVPVMRTAKEKEERAEKMELEMMAEDFKANSPLKKKK